MNRGRFLVEVNDALELVELAPDVSSFQEHFESVTLPRLAPHHQDVVAMLWLLSEFTRSYMTARPGGVDAEARRLRLHAMEQSSKFDRVEQ